MEKIWLNNYHDGVPHEIDPDLYSSLMELIEEGFCKFNNSCCYSNYGTKLTYNRIDYLSRCFAGWLQSQGWGRGDRLAIMLPNVLQYPVAMLGALRAGVTIVNINPLYTSRELNVILQDSGATCVLVLANFAHVLQDALNGTQVKRVVVTEIGDLLGVLKGRLINFAVKYLKKMVKPYHLPDVVAFKAVCTSYYYRCYQRPNVLPEDIAFLQYTGGTTGGAKGAMLTHRNMIANILQLAAWVDPALSAEPSEGGIVTALPLYHIFSLTGNCLLFFRKGYTNILITNPRDIPGFVKELKRQPFSVMTGVNTLFNALLHNEAFCQLDFSHFRFALGGGMAVQRAVAERWQKVTGLVLLQAYGLTETSPGVSFVSTDAVMFDGSIGLPLPSTEIKICDDNNQEVPVGERGELCVRGPQVMKGYWNQPERTREVLSEDGWLRTGDIAMLDSMGALHLVDRKKDLIIVSGFNVYPNEVEEVIANIKGVREVAVIGVASEEHGEFAKAFIVRSDPTLMSEEILHECHRNLTNYKVPREIEFRNELPKTNVGKILRRALREENTVILSAPDTTASPTAATTLHAASD